MLEKAIVLEQSEDNHLIRQLRQLTALSHEQLAAQLGVAYCTVNRWENGHIQPSVLALKPIRTMLKELHLPESNLQKLSQQ